MDLTVRLTVDLLLRHPGLLYEVLRPPNGGPAPRGGWYSRVRNAAVDRVQADFFRSHPDGLATAQGFRIFLQRLRHGLSAQVVYFGVYEPRTSRLIRSLVTPESLVVDVGANIGWFTLLTAGRAKEVWSFEPEATNFGLLQRSVEVNGLKNVTVRQSAVGSRDGETGLWLAGIGSGLHSIARQVGASQITVPCRRLDSLFPASRIGLLKVDVEGAEPEVIAGASGLIDSGRLDAVVMEWNAGAWPGKMDLLKPFDAFLIDGVTRFHFRTRPPEGNILLRPRQRGGSAG
jgi:FkbM family methyltransferase